MKRLIALIAIGLLIALNVPISGPEPVSASPGQYARPDSDIDTSDWIREPTSGGFYDKIDETDPVDTDYVWTGTNLGDCEFGLSDVSDPGTSSGHKISARCRCGVDFGTRYITVKLMQGTTEIASYDTDTLSTTWTYYNYTLTAGEANSITDYTDLRFKFIAHRTDTNVRVSWAQFEVPDAGGGTYTVTYYFNSHSSTVWTNAGQFDDGSLDLHAWTSGNGNEHYFDGNTCPGTDLGTITKVELRAGGAAQSGECNDDIRLIPVFSAGDGSAHDCDMPCYGTSGKGWSSWQDITSDTNAPSPWTWTAVQSLDCRAQHKVVGSQENVLGAAVQIRVTYTTEDTQEPTYSDIAHNTTNRGDPIEFSCKWTDNAGLSGYIFGTNNTGTWQNESWAAFSGNPDWANVTKTLTSSVGVVVQYKWWANDTSDLWNSAMPIQSLTTTSDNNAPVVNSVDVTTGSGGGPGWLTGWGKRVKITIDHNDIDDSLSNFPVLIYLSTSSGRLGDDVTFVFDEVGSSSKKIAVTRSDGETQCYVEIEKWDYGSEKAWLWVKVPSISSSSDTDLYLYYDSSQDPNTDWVGDVDSATAQNVWDTKFNAVWHLSEASGGTNAVKDSTVNSNDGNDTGGPTFGATGMTDSAINFDGSNDHIDFGTPSSLELTSQGTLEAWVKFDTNPKTYAYLVGKDKGGSVSQVSYGMTREGGVGFKLFVSSGSNIVQAETSTSSWSTGTWYYFVGRWNGSYLQMFVNASADGSAATQTLNAQQDNTQDVQVGCGYSTTCMDTAQVDGIMDEVRISATGRPFAWIKATFESGRDHLVDFGTEEEASGESVTDMDAYTEYNLTIGVTDDDQLSDLVNLTVIAWGPSSSETDADQVKQHYTYKWTSAGDWVEVGPDGSPPYDHMGSDSDAPSLSGTSGTFHLEFKLSKVAEDTEGAAKWTFKVYAYDAEASDSMTDQVGMNFYSEVSLNATQVTWSGVPEEDDIAPNGTVRCTVISNDDFDLQVKGTNLTYGGYKIEVGNITADDDQWPSEGSETGVAEIQLTESYQDLITGYPSQDEAGVNVDIWYFLDIPSKQEMGTYSNTLNVNVVDSN